MTIQETLAEGKKLLKTPIPSSFVDTPDLDAVLLLSEVLHENRVQLIAFGNKAISEQDRHKFFDLISRRKKGECIAYILGHKEFRGLEFIVNRHVLVPRPDTETLAEAALEYIDSTYETGTPRPKRSCLSLLDLCTGSGAIAVSLKNERPFLEVTAADISTEALETAKLNADRLLNKGITLIQSDLFSTITDTFNIIVSNPPYIPSGVIETLAPEVRQEPKIALDGGADGLVLVRKIISRAPEHLHQGGVLLLEAAPEQMQEIKKLLEASGFIGIRIFKDLAGRERVISGKIDPIAG